MPCWLTAASGPVPCCLARMKLERSAGFLAEVMASSRSSISRPARLTTGSMIGCARSAEQVRQIEPRISPVPGSVTGAAVQASAPSASAKCSSPRIEIGPACFSAVPTPLVPMMSSATSNPGASRSLSSTARWPGSVTCLVSSRPWPSDTNRLTPVSVRSSLSLLATGLAALASRPSKSRSA
ncbi:MAG TPA: hypothetical protein VH637_19675 [Streptosporangiaceae bacterium]|jgi:hypothetical protein